MTARARRHADAARRGADAIPFFAAERTWAARGERYAALIAAALASGRALQGPAVARSRRRSPSAASAATPSPSARAPTRCSSRWSRRASAPATRSSSRRSRSSPRRRASCAPAPCRCSPTSTSTSCSTPAPRAPRCRRARGRSSPSTSSARSSTRPALQALADEHGVALVEDAAQALGARARSPPRRDARAARAAGRAPTVAPARSASSCCSFDPTKTVAAPGSGGAVLTDDDDLAAHLRRLRWHGRDEAGRHVELGYNSQLPTASAAVLHDKLVRDDAAWTQRRRAIAARYDEALAGSRAPAGRRRAGPHARLPQVRRAQPRRATRCASACASAASRRSCTTPRRSRASRCSTAAAASRRARSPSAPAPRCCRCRSTRSSPTPRSSACARPCALRRERAALAAAAGRDAQIGRHAPDSYTSAQRTVSVHVRPPAGAGTTAV